jgi:hypothetical protein
MIDNTAENMEVIETIATENNEMEVPEIDTDNEPEIDAEVEEEEVPFEYLDQASFEAFDYEAQLEYIKALKKWARRQNTLALREIAKKQKKIEKLKKQLLALGAEI